MDDENWIAAQSARDALAPKRWERRGVAQHLADMIRDGVVPARCQRLVHTRGDQTTELKNVFLNDEVRALMRRADALSWSCQTLDFGSISFSYTTIEPRRDRFAVSPRRTRNSVAIYGLMLLQECLPPSSEKGSETVLPAIEGAAASGSSPLFHRASAWSEIERWYLARVESSPPVGFTRAEDEAAGKLVGISRDRIRDLRNEHAPVHWKADGPKKTRL